MNTSLIRSFDVCNIQSGTNYIRESHSFIAFAILKPFDKYCICNGWGQIWSIKVCLFGYFHICTGNTLCIVSKMEAERSQMFGLFGLFGFISLVFPLSKSAQINHVFHPSIAYATLFKYLSIGNAIL